MKNERENPHEQPCHEPDQLRRRLTKAGLSAPVVLGTLASRPVLGQSLHHCTPSGHISGFASPNPNAPSCAVGLSVSHYASSLGNWPAEFTKVENNQTKTRDFNDSPNGAGLVLFADAFERQKTGGQLDTSPATVWDVLKGYPVMDNGGMVPNMVLVAKSNNVDLPLGQQAIAACMNALSINNFPISAITVVNMFNGVFLNGTDNVTDKNNWDKEHLKAYFQTLQ